MRAARCHAHGLPSGLVVEDIASPVAGPGEAVVDVAVAAVNFADALIVADAYQVSAPVPFTPGSEFAGLVSSVAADVTSVKPGDRVSGAVFVGAFAQQVAVVAAGLEPIADAVELRQAAACGVAYATAYHALRAVAEVAPGEWVLVLGAAGGVGLAAVELAVLARRAATEVPDVGARRAPRLSAH